MQKEKVLQLIWLFAEKLGGSISDVKLMKLLYFTDRLSLITSGHPISYDDYFSLNRGPILSKTKNLIDTYSDPDYKYLFNPSELSKSPKGYPVKNITSKSIAVDFDYLSEIDIQIASNVFDAIGSLDDDEIVNYSHRKDICPEWTWPDGSSIPINIANIFSSIGLTEEEIAVQVEEVNYHKKILNL